MKNIITKTYDDNYQKILPGKIQEAVSQKVNSNSLFHFIGKFDFY